MALDFAHQYMSFTKHEMVSESLAILQGLTVPQGNSCSVTMSMCYNPDMIQNYVVGNTGNFPYYRPLISIKTDKSSLK